MSANMDGFVGQLLKFGWDQSAPEAIIEMAKEMLQVKSRSIDESLIHLGVATQEQIAKIRIENPRATTDDLALHIPRSRQKIDRVLCYQADCAWYEDLSVLTLHELIQGKEMLVVLENMGAMLMETDKHKSVLVFSSFKGMLAYQTSGRVVGGGAKFPDDMVCAIGRDDVVLSLVADVTAGVSSNAEAGSGIWYAAQSLTKEQRLLSRLLDYALANEISDISLESKKDGSGQAFGRMFGDIYPLQIATSISKEDLSKAIRFLMAKAGANPSGARVRDPRDGQITYKSQHGEVFLRLSFLPLNHIGSENDNISVSMRLLSRSEKNVSLTDLKLQPAVVEQMSNAVRMSHGLILVAGPTNSGKSTTIGGMVGEHVKHFGAKRKRISIEDPVERFISGVIQANVPGHIEDAFSRILRSIKRHDPDVIWVGEIRDRETADVCVASSVSGHLVFSTIHAGDSMTAYDSLSRSISADKEFQLVESMGMIVSQRLVKKVCPHCSSMRHPRKDEISVFNGYMRSNNHDKNIPDKIIQPNESGCKECRLGYTGIVPINEVLPFTREVKNMYLAIMNGENLRADIARQRTVTLFDSVYEYFEKGMVELEDILI